MFILGIAMMALSSVGAQDTVHIRDMRLINRYFVPVWPDAFPTITDPKGNQYIRGWVGNMGENLAQAKEEAYLSFILTHHSLVQCIYLIPRG